MILPFREYGKHLTIQSFTGHQVTLQRGDGLTFPVYLSPYPSKLQEFVSNGQWDSAQRLCSSIKVSEPHGPFVFLLQRHLVFVKNDIFIFIILSIFSFFFFLD